MYINIPSQYDVVSRAKRFHIGFYAKCKKKNVMKGICAAYVDSRKKHFEPPHDKTNKMIFVPSEVSDHPGHPPSLIRVFTVRSMGSLGPNFASADSTDSDQSGRMPRLTLVFTGRTDHFVGFVMPWLNFHIETTSETIAYGIVTNLHMRN